MNVITYFSKDSPTSEELRAFLVTAIASQNFPQLGEDTQTNYRRITLFDHFKRTKKSLKPSPLTLLLLATQNGFRAVAENATDQLPDRASLGFRKLVVFLLIRAIDSEEANDEAYLNHVMNCCTRLRSTCEVPNNHAEKWQAVAALLQSLNAEIERDTFDSFNLAVLRLSRSKNAVELRKKYADLGIFFNSLSEVTKSPTTKESHSYVTTTVKLWSPEPIEDLDQNEEADAPPNERDIYFVKPEDQEDFLKARGFEFSRSLLSISPFLGNRKWMPESKWHQLNSWLYSAEYESEFEKLSKCIAYICLQTELSPKEALITLYFPKKSTSWMLTDDRTVVRANSHFYQGSPDGGLYASRNNSSVISLPTVCPPLESLGFKPENMDKQYKSILSIAEQNLPSNIKLRHLSGQALLWDVANNSDAALSQVRHGHPHRPLAAMLRYTSDWFVDHHTGKPINLGGSSLKFDLNQIRIAFKNRHNKAKTELSQGNLIGFWNGFSENLLRLLYLCCGARGVDLHPNLTRDLH